MSRQSLCTFYAGDLFLGLPTSQVQEILRPQPVTAVPLVPPALKGLINLRGQIIEAVDLRLRLGLPPRPPEGASMNVVVRLPEETVSLLVDRVGGVMAVEEDECQPPPETLRGEAREMIRGAFAFPDKVLLSLVVDKILDF